MPKYKYQHGFCVMRAQPFHIGHQKLINQMLQDCARVTVALGSIQEQGTDRNPFNYKIRKKMIQNVYQNKPEYKRLKIIGLFDINNPDEWGDFVIDCLTESLKNVPIPDVYYAGSQYDAHWFKNKIKNICLVDRTDLSFPFVNASMLRDMIKFGDIRWKNFVNPSNQSIIEEYFKSQNCHL